VSEKAYHCYVPGHLLIYCYLSQEKHVYKKRNTGCALSMWIMLATMFAHEVIREARGQ